ncbi:MAG: type II toxin-antitoxin system VapC family toxin [Alphaproteobacteria bacterium]
MTAILLDTHTWAWSIIDQRKLSTKAKAAILEADSVHVSPITFFEIALKVYLGKWPLMAPHAGVLPDLLEAQGAMIAPLDVAICLSAGGMSWRHRDPFDRMLAATSIEQNLALVSADTVFDDILTRVW